MELSEKYKNMKTQYRKTAQRCAEIAKDLPNICCDAGEHIAYAIRKEFEV